MIADGPARVEAGDADDRRLLGVDLARDDVLQRGDDAGADRDGVDRVLRDADVAAATADLDAEDVARGQRGARGGPSTVPSGSGAQRCSPMTVSTPSMTPASTIPAAPPGSASSPGSKRKRISPGRCSRMPASTVAAPSSIDVWPSCPQACMTPGFSEANGSPVSSSMGSASMSARIASVGPGRPPTRRATTLVPDGRVTSRSSAASFSATKRDVSVSWKDSSGWACRCRRHATTSGVTSSTSRSTVPSMTRVSLRSTRVTCKVTRTAG